MGKLNAGKASILALTAIFALVSFLLAKSFTGVSAHFGSPTPTPSCVPFDDYAIKTSSTGGGSGDGTTNHAIFDFHNGDQNVDISGEAGYTIQEVWLDLHTGSDDWVSFGSGAGNYDPSGSTKIDRAKAHVVRTCPTPTATPEPEKVNICHATDSDSNPYVSQSPDIQNDGSLSGGHLNHTGPIWFDGIDDEWGDIIPPYAHGDFNYPGMNWTDLGQAIYRAECDPKAVTTPTPVSTSTPEPTPTPGDLCTNLDGFQDKIPDGWFQLNTDSTVCRQFQYGGAPTPPPAGGQVLGASTMAGTGSFEENLYLAIMSLGGLFTTLGFKNVKKAFQKAN